MKVKKHSFYAHFANDIHSTEDWLTSKIVQKILGTENPFGNMNLTLFSQIG